MAIRSISLVPSTIAKSLICVDGMVNYDISGTFYNPYMSEPAKFNSVSDVIKIMESFFDKIAFPQSYYEDRAFYSKPKTAVPKTVESEVRQYMSDEIFDTEKGKKATFVVQVQFRQNATWQGTITWTDEKKTQRFRSALEMVKLMDGALNGGNDAGISLAGGWEDA